MLSLPPQGDILLGRSLSLGRNSTLRGRKWSGMVSLKRGENGALNMSNGTQSSTSQVPGTLCEETRRGAIGQFRLWSVALRGAHKKRTVLSDVSVGFSERGSIESQETCGRSWGSPGYEVGAPLAFRYRFTIFE